MLLSSVALSILESSHTPTWWMVTVPKGTEHAVAKDLDDEFGVQGGHSCLWPGQEPGSAPISLMVVTEDTLPGLSRQLDELRSKLGESGTVVLVIADSKAGDFLHDAPHMASFVAGRVVATTAGDDEAPPEYVARRLASLREAYGMTDAQAREAFE